MASQNSFDVTTGVDLQEVDNAVNQARKEVAQRYDFKGKKTELEFDRAHAQVKLEAEDAFHMKALVEILKGKMVKRGVPLKNLEIPEDEAATANRVKKTLTLKLGISKEKGREIVKAFKAEKFKKVQLAIQDDQLRVTSPSKDVLQDVMTFLKGKDWGIELQFGNYR